MATKKTTKTAKKITPKRIVKAKKPVTYKSIGQVKRAMAHRRMARGTFASVSDAPALAGIKLRIGSAKGGTVFESTAEDVLKALLKEKGLKVDFDVPLLPLASSPAV